MREGVAVVIPAWRETGRLPPLVRTVAAMRGCAEIVVACTRAEEYEVREALAGAPAVRVVAARRGRAAQMNAGAACTSAEWLLFLHADSTPHPDALTRILAIADPREVGGSCRLALDAGGWRPRLIEWMVRRRVRLLGLPYGDQGLFVRRRAFAELGGYRDLPLMEDVDFVRRLRRLGRLRHLSCPVVTSARRWERDGWTRRTLSNWSLMLQYLAGASPARLARRYTGRCEGIVGVFARTPAAGGKSRLWRALGREPDVRLLAAMLEDTLDLVERAGDVDRVLVAQPAPGERTVNARAGWDVILQEGDDLGMRMHNALVELLGLGYESAILIGSDVPTLPAEVLRRAVSLLADGRTDLVLGPSEDGGYYLVGTRTPHPELFTGIPWSTPAVLARTLERARALGLSVALVDRWYDIDGPDDLRRAASELTPEGARTKRAIRDSGSGLKDS